MPLTACCIAIDSMPHHRRAQTIETTACKAGIRVPAASDLCSEDAEVLFDTLFLWLPDSTVLNLSKVIYLLRPFLRTVQTVKWQHDEL